MPRSSEEVCNYCEQPATHVHSYMDGPVRMLCRPCYKRYEREHARPVEFEDIPPERSLSHEEMVAELLEIREATRQ